MSREREGEEGRVTTNMLPVEISEGKPGQNNLRTTDEDGDEV